jgi:hypothetical protein
MTSKLFQSSYFGFISLAVVAPAAHAAMLPDDPSVKHSPSYMSSLLVEKSFLEMPFIVKLSDALTASSVSREPSSEGVDSEPSADVAKSRPTVQIPNTLPKMSSPIPHITSANKARILVLDAEALNFGQIVPLTDATATWIGVESRLDTKSNNNGVIDAPYPKTRAQRFVVNAKGYIPAVGYAIKGNVSVAPMYKASLVQPLVQTLDIKDFNSHIVIGKALDKNLKPVPKLKIDLSEAESTVNYSLGSWGIFMPGLDESGPAGDFVVTGLSSSIQYFMPVENHSAEEWPSTVVDLSGMPQVVSLAIPKAEREFSHTKVLDAFVLEKPEGQVNLTIGGQRGVYIPDVEGETLIENLYVRPSIDVLEVRAPSYLKSWINTPANPSLMPSFSPLLSEFQIQQMLEPSRVNWNSSQGIVVGTVKANDYRTNGPLEIQVMGPNGRTMKDALVIYFDENNIASSQLQSTEHNHRFMIVGLEDGEWSLVAIDGTTSDKPQGIGATVVRTSAGVVSFVEI